MVIGTDPFHHCEMNVIMCEFEELLSRDELNHDASDSPHVDGKRPSSLQRDEWDVPRVNWLVVICTRAYVLHLNMFVRAFMRMPALNMQNSLWDTGFFLAYVCM